MYTVALASTSVLSSTFACIMSAFSFCLRTLGQFLSKLDKELDEKEIVLMFQEMVMALKYIHEHNILHR